MLARVCQSLMKLCKKQDKKKRRKTRVEKKEIENEELKKNV